jgi:uncharacterized protein (DUF58 family)
MSLRQKIVQLLEAVEGGAWLNFFFAVFGLALAFASALLSTASREAGDRLSTAIFASFALLLAGVVAITTVPRMARRVASQRVRESLHYEITREGVGYLALTLLIAIAALNTGNNLLFIVVATMLGAVLVSGVVSAVMIGGLEAGVHLPHHVFAGQSYSGAVLLHNRRRLPVFSISVVPPRQKSGRAVWKWQRTEFVFPAARSGRKPLLRWPDLFVTRAAPPPAEPPVFEQSVYFPYLPGGYRQSAAVNLCFPRRGIYTQRGVGISTRFPFSFLTKSRAVTLNQEVLVYPCIEPTDALLQVLPLISGEMEAHVRGRGSDLYRIRDYEPEDTARHVDWKASAKSGELKVREYTREEEHSLCIIFDNPAPGVLDEEHYEQAINTAASIAWHFFQKNADLSFAAPGLILGSDIYAFLEYLARAEPGVSDGFLAMQTGASRYNIIVTACARGQIPTALWQSSWVIFAQD